MKYEVHRFDINMEKDKDKLKQFLNSLKGDVVAIIPNIKPIFKPMGATAKVDFLYIVENFRIKYKSWRQLISYSLSIMLQIFYD